MIYWAPFLHFYQPSFQFHKTLDKICRESYRPLIKVFFEHPHAKVTINICGVLTEMLSEHNGEDILDGFRQLSRRSQLEFTDSANFHAILPLIPPAEARRQIRLNRRVNEHFLGSLYKPRGFFPPEMCSSAKLLGIIKNLGYDWVLLSGVAHPQAWPVDFISVLSSGSSPLKVLYRDDIVSNKISFRNLDSDGFIKEIMAIAADKKDAYIITAMDAETFGHHIPQWENTFLAKTFEAISGFKKIKVVTLSELINAKEICRRGREILKRVK